MPERAHVSTIDTATFEDGLIEAIEPIRQFALATAIFHLFEAGIYDRIDDAPSSVAELASALGHDRAKLQGLLSYLRNEELVTLDDGEVALTRRGRALAKYRAWYTMLIGGYGQTFMAIGDHLGVGSGGAARDIVHVGVGSCGISRHDAFPLTQELIDKMRRKPEVVCDLGCGNGMYLVEFCRYFPGLRAVGIEPSEASCAAARDFIAEAGFSDRIEIVCNSAVEFVADPKATKPDLYVLGFVLHEILGQEGERGVIDFLSKIRAENRGAHVVVIEVSDQIDEAKQMQHGLARAYYNPYYLLHYFTNQKLETHEYWMSVFARSGFEVLARATTSAEVDSTGFELGYLLRA
ncbi:2-ketoarginine methyltransferase [Nannocystis radixulma]|uniref:2-ketoarginine methyltransferase n=1 Tax=Nannocystis radixulma TaxID=2995305 RepID=A0ABT5BNI3_9BACT|nr:2-ketoarginine methyltransferase [Nannocystis radixulma]MDC0675724.1 2-ketoarginine methyltransferase [Nannocystis radixulma]